MQIHAGEQAFTIRVHGNITWQPRENDKVQIQILWSKYVAEIRICEL